MQNTIQESDYIRYLDLIGNGENGLSAWLEELKASLQPTLDDGKSISCMVFNANPFTNGHRYLAEIASRRSGHVVVFVIEGKTESGGRGNHEDTGIEFCFEDRFSLVRQGLSDLGNVLVVPSGKYLISRDDFPQGYLSEQMGSAPAHALLDSRVFCEVCKGLGAKLAFAGDEPRDELSEIHLNALRAECAANGIVLKVAERKRLEDRYISSSLVRDAIEKKDQSLISRLVPSHVLDFLSGHIA